MNYEQDAKKIGALILGAERLIERAKELVRKNVHDLSHEKKLDEQTWYDWSDIEYGIISANASIVRTAGIYRSILNREPK